MVEQTPNSFNLLLLLLIMKEANLPFMKWETEMKNDNKKKEWWVFGETLGIKMGVA